MNECPLYLAFALWCHQSYHLLFSYAPGSILQCQPILQNLNLKILTLHLFPKMAHNILCNCVTSWTVMNVVAPPAVWALELCFHIPALLHVLAHFLQIIHCNDNVDFTLPATVPQSMPLCFVCLCSFMDFFRLEAYLRDVIHHSGYNVQQTFFN